MANPHRGEVTLEADGESYTLAYSVNALCEIEAELDLPVAFVAAQVAKPTTARMTYVRAMLWAGLRQHHPDITLAQAGVILGAFGVPEAIERIGVGFDLAFPESKKGAGANPRRAKG